MNNEVLIGMENELKSINDLIRQKQSVIILGEKGTGKSEVIRNFILGKNTGTFLFSKESRDLKDSLANLAVSSGEYKENVREQNIDSLKKIVYALISRTPECVIFDNLGRVKPKFNSFITYVLDKKIPLLISCRGLQKQHIGHLRWISFAFNKIELTNLDRKKSTVLIGYFVKEYGITSEKIDEFKNGVIKYSGGNPSIIKKLCLLAKDPKYNRNGLIDVRLMDLDRKIHEVAPGNNT